MPNKMLIDAGHPEETRVVVLRGNRVEEFDFESASKKQLRGNIYLAKVTRVEPSLQAAFVEYGGNRHGFLAFSEIHPDYYQIPIADRQALIEEEARAERAEEENERRGRRSRRHGRSAQRRSVADETLADGASSEEPSVHDRHAEDGQPENAPTEDAHAEGLEAAASPAADTPDDEAVAAAVPTEGTAARAMPIDAGSAEATHAADAAEDVANEPASGATALEAILIAPGVTLAESTEAASLRAEEKEEALEAKLDAILDDAADDPAPAAVRDSALAQEAEEETEDAEPSEGEAAAEDAADHDDAETEDRVRHDDNDDEHRDDEHGDDEHEDDEAAIEQIGGDALEEVSYRPSRPRRAYKIQEVIKRRQVLLVQVTKEERGNKGAALTTYLSLAGRYSVLMPNTARGGGISRKITNAVDRKRLKTIAEDLEVPEGMGVILRTAGAARTKAEVKRDFEYLLRMWETVRELTLKSTAPTLVYEEGSLIKRAIRDLYNKDIDEVLVAGDEGFREAKDFMRMLMPSHAKNVKLYHEVEPIFVRSGVESQLDAMFGSQVTLKSGGYIVINQTEALVAIDVNSGRSTREHNIEDTALRTNLEAADEVSRQLRLRDLAGLIVVDFIDMEEGRNNRAVERRLKEALKFDRARIQIGRISHFGLLEMSRQRIRTGVLEGSTVMCPHCMGAGMVRSTASIALHVLRSLEEMLIRNASFNILVHTRTEIALYILNQKRAHLREIEARFGVGVMVLADPSLTGTVYHAIERGEPVDAETANRKRAERVHIDSVRPIFDEDDEDNAAETADVAEPADEEEAEVGSVAVDEAEDGDETEAHDADGQPPRDGDDSGRRKRRRRRRRGRDRDGPSVIAADAPQPPDDGLAMIGGMGLAPLHAQNPDEPDETMRPVTHDASALETPDGPTAGPDVSAEGAADAAGEAPPTQPVQDGPDANTRGRLADEALPPVVEGGGRDADGAAEPIEAEQPEAAPEPEEPPMPKRSGWWQRAKATFGG